MGLKVINPRPRKMVLPVSANGTTGDTIYEGQLVYKALGGILPKGAASGVMDTSGKANVPFAVVCGILEKTPSYSASYKANYISTPASVAQAHVTGRTDTVFGHSERWAYGDTIYWVEAEVITPESIIVAPIYNAAYGTAPSVETVTSGGAASTGLGCVTGTTDFTPVAQNATIHFRSGSNKGIERVLDSTSTTTHTWDMPTPADPAVGDTCVLVNIPFFGDALMQLDSESMYIDNSQALTSHYYGVLVWRLYLDRASEERAEFSLMSEHWNIARA